MIIADRILLFIIHYWVPSTVTGMENSFHLLELLHIILAGSIDMIFIKIFIQSTANLFLLHKLDAMR